MIYALKKSAVSLTLKTLAILMLVFFYLVSFTTFARSQGNVGNDPIGLNNGVATIKFAEQLLANLLSVVLSIAGIVLFVMFLIGGFRYLTAGGDAKATEAAKATLTHAIAGLLVLIFAFIFLQLIEVITGVKVSIFRITRP